MWSGRGGERGLATVVSVSAPVRTGRTGLTPHFARHETCERCCDTSIQARRSFPLSPAAVRWRCCLTRGRQHSLPTSFACFGCFEDRGGRGFDMTIFGWDCSNWDHGRGPVDIARAVREGISFVTHKATEGRGYTDPYYGSAAARARGVVPLFGAYHVLHPDPIASIG